MKNTKAIYDDSKQKAIEELKTEFRDLFIKEGIDPDQI